MSSAPSYIHTNKIINNNNNSNNNFGSKNMNRISPLVSPLISPLGSPVSKPGSLSPYSFNNHHHTTAKNNGNNNNNNNHHNNGNDNTNNYHSGYPSSSNDSSSNMNHHNIIVNPHSSNDANNYPIMSPSDRRSWTLMEDNAILQAVSREGVRNWVKIASEVSSLASPAGNVRTGKQCRERFHNHLDPNITKCPWTKEEEDIIITMQAKMGNKWAEIAKYLPGKNSYRIKL